jgi:hypothetical protein
MGEWNDADGALWHTIDILAAAVSGRIRERQPVLTQFAPQHGPEEIVLAQGVFRLSEFVAAGDGSYQHTTFIAGGTGAFGLAMLAGTAVGSAVGNSKRRAAAAAAAAQRWRQVDEGWLFVSSHGFYLQTRTAFLPWSWHHVDAAQVVERSCTLLQGSSTRGPVSYLVHSPWAELVFVLWATARHRRHPQLLDGSWLPPGWVDHAKACGEWPQERVLELEAGLHRDTR